MWSKKYCDSNQNQDLKDVIGNFLEYIQFHKIPANVLMREVHPLGLVPSGIIVNALAYQVRVVSEITMELNANTFSLLVLFFSLFLLIKIPSIQSRSLDIFYNFYLIRSHLCLSLGMSQTELVAKLLLLHLKKYTYNIIISLIFDEIDTVTSSTFSAEDRSLRISSEMR